MRLEIDIVWLTVLIFGSLLVLLMAGLPLAFVTGGLACVFLFLFAGTGLEPYGVLILMMVILVVLGMFLDWVGILLLAVPIFIPMMKTMSFDGVFGLPGGSHEELPLWFGVVYMVNMQMSFITPPFGYALFYLKSVAPRRLPWGRSIARPFRF
jgi:TRAP-type mannitol/chloroaromatic compound transport system permease large subunit